MTPLSLRRDPVRLLVSRDLRGGAWYLLAYQVTGWVLFSVALTTALTGAALGITLAGLPLLVAAAAVIRWCANVERARLRPFCGDVQADHRTPAGTGLVARFTATWRDPATWREVAYLIGLSLPLAVLDLIVLTVWSVFITAITLPVWYWAPWQTVHGVRFHGYALGYFPNGPHASPGYGFYVDTLPRALLVAAVSLILFLAFNYVVVATARAHVTIARSLLGTPADPLREAKKVLSGPGPLAMSEAADHSGLLERSIPNGS
jgi:Putative sensor